MTEMESTGMMAPADGTGFQPRVLISAMLKWYLHHTAKAFENRNALCGYWVSNANVSGVSPFTTGGSGRITCSRNHFINCHESSSRS